MTAKFKFEQGWGSTLAETHMTSADFALLYWKGEEEKERKFCKDFTHLACEAPQNSLKIKFRMGTICTFVFPVF